MSVTVQAIQAIIDAYIAFAKGGPFPLKLVKNIHTCVTALGGTWEYEEDKLVVSCFSGTTIICWRFSGIDAAGAATLYENFMLKNYNVWVGMSSADKRTFQAECRRRTDSLPDWQQITRDIAPRTNIIEQAITVTSAMYGYTTPETTVSEALWNGRF